MLEDQCSGDRFRCASQQCSGSPRDTYLAGAEDTAAARYWTARCGDDGSANFGRWCIITVRYDRASVKHELLAQCLQAVSTKSCAGRWSGTACAAGVVRYQGAGSAPRSRRVAAGLRRAGDAEWRRICAATRFGSRDSGQSLPAWKVGVFRPGRHAGRRLHGRHPHPGEAAGAAIEVQLLVWFSRPDHAQGIEFEDRSERPPRRWLTLTLEEIGERAIRPADRARIYPEMRNWSAHVARGHTVSSACRR